MATLYEIDKQIAECVDIETGEIIDIEKLKQLEMERYEKCENVAVWIKNLNSDIKQLKEERDRLESRIDTLNKKAESLKAFLSYSLDGAKLTSAKVSVSYRASERVEFIDEDEFIATMQRIGRDDLLRYGKPTPNKTEIKKALHHGEEIEGAFILQSQNIQIK